MPNVTHLVSNDARSTQRSIWLYVYTLIVCIKSLALADNAVQYLFRVRSDQLRGSPGTQERTFSHYQEQLQQVGKYEDHLPPRSPGSGISSEDLTPGLGEKCKGEAPAQGPAEVGM